MLIRFIAKNLLSFKDETEFNLLPNKTQRLAHHKKRVNSVDFLRYSVVYGANGSGKSNLIKGIALLEDMIDEGKIIGEHKLKNSKFKLSNECSDLPITMGIEFAVEDNTYFYSITFDDGVILEEALLKTSLGEDTLLFTRSFENGKQQISLGDEYALSEKNALFLEILSEKLIAKNELLITFLSHKYSEEFSEIDKAFQWFAYTLVVVKPDASPGALAQMLDKNEDLLDFGNAFIPTLNTGIDRISIAKHKFNDFIASSSEDNSSEDLHDIMSRFKDNPKKNLIMREVENGEEISIVMENNEVIAKQIIPIHRGDVGQEVEFNLGYESDGTKRLLEYLPAFNSVINQERVFIIDEIERSIHPITIKDIIKKISLDENAKGQLIFTTHESCLLDQDILRPDEIWFAQKALDGSSKLYPLSDFNVHHTANLESGYLAGRYGGIPFLSNLEDLNWHKYEVSDQE